MKLSHGQIDAAVAWWTERLRIGHNYGPETIAFDQKNFDAGKRRIEAAAPTPEQLLRFGELLEQNLGGDNIPLEVGTTTNRNFALLLEAAEEAGISRDRFQPWITMLFLAEGVQVRDGFAALPTDIYSEPLTEERALEILETNDAVAEDEGTGDSRGRAALAFLRERLKSSTSYQSGDLKHVELWNAINDVVRASGGNPGNTSVERQKAVARVEHALGAITGRLGLAAQEGGAS